jgi:hypothetical protein
MTIAFVHRYLARGKAGHPQSAIRRDRPGTENVRLGSEARCIDHVGLGPEADGTQPQGPFTEARFCSQRNRVQQIAAHAAPMHQPASTSVGKWTPR